MATPEKITLTGPTRPLGSPESPQFYLPAANPDGVYTPMVYGAAAIHFADRKRKIDVTRPVAFVVPLDPATKAADWDTAEAIEIRPAQLLRDVKPAEQAPYLPLPAGAMQVKTFTRWAKSFDRWLARTQRLDVPPREDAAPADPPDPGSIGPKRGGVSVELVAIVWQRR